MSDIYLITGIIISLAITTAFGFMVSANISQNRAALAERVNTDYDYVQSKFFDFITRLDTQNKEYVEE